MWAPPRRPNLSSSSNAAGVATTAAVPCHSESARHYGSGIADTNTTFVARLKPVKSTVRYRMPTALERAGDFSQTDNSGKPYPYIKDPLSPAACSVERAGRAERQLRADQT